MRKKSTPINKRTAKFDSPSNSPQNRPRLATAASIASLIPTWLFSDASTAQRVTIRTDQEIGIVRPELHGHFAEHLGSCVYGGLWVGKNSPIPNTNGYRKQADRLPPRSGYSCFALARRMFRGRLSLARWHRRACATSQARQYSLGRISRRQQFRHA